jgi:hypothetical protein
MAVRPEWRSGQNGAQSKMTFRPEWRSGQNGAQAKMAFRPKWRSGQNGVQAKSGSKQQNLFALRGRQHSRGKNAEAKRAKSKKYRHARGPFQDNGRGHTRNI